MSNKYKPFTPKNEFKRILFATRNSLRGFQAVFRDEAAFRAQLVVLFLILVPAALLADSFIEFALLIGVWILVIAGEFFNSAIEAVVDRIGPEIHPLSGKAKDCGSALTLTLMALAGFVWLMFLFDHWNTSV